MSRVFYFYEEGNVKKVLLIFMAVILCARIASAEENKEETKADMFENLLDFMIRPAEEILGSVVDLKTIVISPSRMREPIMMSASSIAVIGKDTIEHQHPAFMKNIIIQQAGVSKTGNGPFGGTTTVRMRGANPNHTLLIIDNMKVFDPVSPDGAFNFAHLSLDNIEQIEILKGPQGTLYGSDAIGGVINVTSKKPYESFFNAGFEFGSYWTFNEYINMGGYEKGLHYSFAFSQLNTDGISYTDEDTISDVDEDDYYRRTSIAGRVDYEIFDNLTIGGTFRNIFARYDYDDTFDTYPYPPRDNDDLIGKSNLLLYSFYIEHAPLKWYDYSIIYAYLDNFREDFDFQDIQNEWYEGKVDSFDFQNNFHILDYDTITTGYEYIHEISDSYTYSYANGENDQSKVFDTNHAFYLQNKIHYKDIIGSTQGIRVDDHSEFGKHATYKIDGFYLAPTGTRFRGVIATGFKAPSLYQLNAPALPAYGFLGGNPDLDPEKTRSYEIGIDQYLFEKTLKLSATYFQIRFRDLIKYYMNPTTYESTYKNVAKAKSLGIELGGELNLFEDKLIIKTNASFMDTKDYSTDREILRVPENTCNINVNAKPISRLNLNANIKYIGLYFDRGTDKIKQHITVNCAADFNLTKNCIVYARIENLLDKHYQEIRNYGMPGFSIYGGARIEF